MVILVALGQDQAFQVLKVHLFEPVLGLGMARLKPGRRLRTRLTDAHEGWGADNSFSLYALERGVSA